MPIKIVFNDALKTEPLLINYMLDFTKPLTLQQHFLAFNRDALPKKKAKEEAKTRNAKSVPPAKPQKRPVPIK